MEKVTFVPGDLVLVSLSVPKRSSKRSGQIPGDGYWPAKVTRILPNYNREVKCYATEEVIKVPVQSIVVYNKETVKATQVDKDSVLAQAMAEIEADFIAISRTAEEIHLSGGAKLVTSVVKSARLLDTIDVGNTLLNLWNSYVEKSLGKTRGICHLPRFIEDFINEHKEVLLGEETYRDLMFHICSLEEVGLISSIEVKSIVEGMLQSCCNLPSRIGTIGSPQISAQVNGSVEESPQNSSGKFYNDDEGSLNSTKDLSHSKIPYSCHGASEIEIQEFANNANVNENQTEEESNQTSTKERDYANYRMDLEVVEMRMEIKMSEASFARFGHLLPPGLAVKLWPN